MKVIITGAAGFLGWHTLIRLKTVPDLELVQVTRDNWAQLPEIAQSADALIHLAGQNRGEPDQVFETNINLAEDIAAAIAHSRPSIKVIFANSIQASDDNPYGKSKRIAGETIGAACEKYGHTFFNVTIPNLFGAHARPDYNTFVATFIDKIIKQRPVEIQDREIGLLHVQEVAQYFAELLAGQPERPLGTVNTSVAEVYRTLVDFHETYLGQGIIPDLGNPFKLGLFNAYRAALFPQFYPLKLKPNRDPRGVFTETVKSLGVGQSSVSTTVPGITRGQHFHLAKLERFAVIQGEATIALRRLFHTDIEVFEVSGDAPVAIDMPIGWVHNITNIGETELVTQFWCQDLFDPDNPDTFPENV